MPTPRDTPDARHRAERQQHAVTASLGPTARWAWECTKYVLIAITLFAFLRAFLVEAFRIPTGSMEPTLLVGDFLLVNKAVYGFRLPFSELRAPAFAEPRRGEIIVFTPPHEPDQNYVKRVVGAPGDTVTMRHHTVIVNGTPITEPYARYTDTRDLRAPAMDWQCHYRASAGACQPTRDVWGPIVVPPGRYLVLGDNRDDSEDSRYWGFVDRTAIKGRPMLVYFSFDPAGPGRLPWATDIRWTRLGAALQ